MREREREKTELEWRKESRHRIAITSGREEFFSMKAEFQEEEERKRMEKKIEITERETMKKEKMKKRENDELWN